MPEESMLGDAFIPYSIFIHLFFYSLLLLVCLEVTSLTVRRLTYVRFAGEKNSNGTQRCRCAFPLLLPGSAHQESNMTSCMRNSPALGSNRR